MSQINGISGSGSGSGGDVVGPASSTDNALVRWDTTTGKLVQNSTVILDDTGNLSAVASVTMSTGGAFRTGTTNANTALIQAYDVDGAAYTTFITLTAANTPTCALSGVTIDGSVIGGVTPAAGSFTTLSATGIATLGSGQIVKSIAPGAYPYDVLTSDYIIRVDTSAARTIRLPDAPATNSTWVIKDDVGTAGTNNISLTTVGGAVTIDGATTQTMNSNWQSLTVFFNGTSYRII